MTKARSACLIRELFTLDALPVGSCVSDWDQTSDPLVKCGNQYAVDEGKWK